jgi:hypothetical protein
LLRGGDEGGTTLDDLQGQTAVSGAPAQNGGPITPATNSTSPVQGKPIGPIRAGQFPDFVGADLASSLAVLRDNQLNYIIIETVSATVPKGIVISQTPAGGARAEGSAAVTLVVSKGETP